MVWHWYQHDDFLVHAALKKHHVAISYNTVREAVAAKIIAPMWLQGEENPADIFTKQLPYTTFIGHVNSMTTRGQA